MIYQINKLVSYLYPFLRFPHKLLLGDGPIAILISYVHQTSQLSFAQAENTNIWGAHSYNIVIQVSLINKN